MRKTPLFACLLACSCVRNPATGKLQLNLVSESQEITLGKQAKAETEQSIGVYKENPKLSQYVADLGKQLSKVSGRPDLPWSYEIANDSSVNAFALPGGPVFVTRGILSYLNSEAELAAVMGHETGHVSARHSANQLSKQEIAQVGLGLGSVLSPAVGSLAQVAGAGLQVLFLKYSRDDETQADELGFRFMTKVGYDPHEMIPLFQMLDGVTQAAGGAKTPEWLETHPDPGNRLQATQDRLKNELKGSTAGMKINKDQYLQAIDGIAFGDDPRQGYFKGDLFLHPELKFQWALPSGWKHQNAAEAVAAQSPKQDAILQLQAAGKISPEEAAQKIFSQQGIQQGPNVDVNGAKVARQFTAQGQQGTIEGIAAFMSKDGNTYMIVGYSPQGGLQTYRDTFRTSMGSFGDLKDSSAQNVKPARVKIVKLDSPMTVDQFNARYPSTAKVDTIALINGVQKGGTIPAGYAKQVLGGTGEPPQ